MVRSSAAEPAVIVRPMKSMALLVLLPACADLTATWEGKCDYGADEVQVTLEITQDGDDLLGSGTLDYLVGNTLETTFVEVDGKLDGEDIEMDLEPESGEEMLIEALLLDRDTIEGECAWVDLVGPAEGTFELARED